MQNLEKVPCLNVTKENLKSIWPSLIKKVNSSSFIGIDFEFSGIGDRIDYGIKDLEIRYNLLSGVVKERSIMSIGLSLFEYVNQKPKSKVQIKRKKLEDGELENEIWKYKVNNFNLFCECDEDDYVKEEQALEFLKKHGFDFEAHSKNAIKYRKGNDQETDNRNEITLRNLFIKIIEKRRPIVMHNGLLDLIYFYHHFYCELPEKVETFIADLNELFKGGIYDTKFICEMNTDLKISFLEYLFYYTQRMNILKIAYDDDHLVMEFDQLKNDDECNKSNGKLTNGELNDQSDINESIDQTDINESNDQTDINESNDQIDINESNNQIDESNQLINESIKLNTNELNKCDQQLNDQLNQHKIEIKFDQEMKEDEEEEANHIDQDILDDEENNIEIYQNKNFNTVNDSKIEVENELVNETEILDTSLKLKNNFKHLDYGNLKTQILKDKPIDLEICKNYRNYGWCKDREECTKSHNIDFILDSKFDNSNSKNRYKNDLKKMKELNEKKSDDALKFMNDCNDEIIKFSEKGGVHSAGFDAFMTSFCFAYFVLEYFEDMPIKMDHVDLKRKLKYAVNRIFIPFTSKKTLHIKRSEFSNPSRNHRIKYDKLFGVPEPTLFKNQNNNNRHFNNNNRYSYNINNNDIRNRNNECNNIST